MTSYRKIWLAALALLMSTVGKESYAASSQGDGGESRTKYLLEEKLHQFFVRTYINPVIFDPKLIEPTELKPGDPPETTALNLIGAMAQGSIQKYLVYAEPETKEKLEQAWFGKGLPLGSIEDEWKRRLAGKYVRLTHRIEYGKTIIIVYETLDRQDRKRIDRSQLAVTRNEHAAWLLVDIEDHPVFKHWQFSGQRKVVTE